MSRSEEVAREQAHVSELYARLDQQRPLARRPVDLLALAARGWQPDVIEPFDLMPGTAQIETLVRLRRG